MNYFKMEKCSKVKNSCKICLSAVTNKNGIQCQGACRKWAHYSCLSYTPGKIQDIKSGALTITCPCPDCVTEEPKEFLTNPPYTCTNHQCPANKQPFCGKDDCPTKKSNPLPASQSGSSESSLGTPDEVTPPISALRLPIYREPRYKPKPVPSPQQKPPANPVSLSNAPCGPTAPCANKILPKVPHMKPPPCPLLTPCPSKDGKKARRPQPCSCRSIQTHSKLKLLKTSSEMNVSSTNSMYVTMQEMCNTVGQLSTQLKQLMCKMMDTVPNTL